MVRIFVVFYNLIFIMKTLIFTACEHYYHGLFSKKKVLMNILTCEYFEHMTV